MIRVCQWQGCIREAEVQVRFDPTKRKDTSGRTTAISPMVYCWDHYCRADDLFDSLMPIVLRQALLRSA